MEHLWMVITMGWQQPIKVNNLSIMNTQKSRQNFDLQEISFSELNNIKGGNLVAFAGLIVGGLKLALDGSYGLGYAVGYYVGSHE
jgi:hypothetical protein